MLSSNPASVEFVFGPRRRGTTGWRVRRCRAQNVERGWPHAASTRARASLWPVESDWAWLHAQDLHCTEGLAFSGCRMRLRSRSLSRVKSPMTYFMHRPFSSTRSSLRIFRLASPPARKASRQADRVAAVTAYLRLRVSGSSQRRSSRTTAILRLADHRPLPWRPVPEASPVVRQGPSAATETASLQAMVLTLILISVQENRGTRDRLRFVTGGIALEKTPHSPRPPRCMNSSRSRLLMRICRPKRNAGSTFLRTSSAARW